MIATSILGRSATSAMCPHCLAITGRSTQRHRTACSVMIKKNWRFGSSRTVCPSSRAATAFSTSRAGSLGTDGDKAARAYSGTCSRPLTIVGRNDRCTVQVSARALISVWARQIPFAARARTDTCSTLARRAKATSSSDTSRGTSSALRIRSTSATVGRILPRSIRLILDCDMTQRTANLSPERPAALRSFRRISPRSLSSRLGKSILTPGHSLGQGEITPTSVLVQIGGIS